MRFLLLLVLLLMGSAAIFQNQPSGKELVLPEKVEAIQYNKANYPVTITNLRTGRSYEQQTFTKPPQRLVCVWHNSIETPIALGVGDRIVAGMGVRDKNYFKPEHREQYSRIPITSLTNLDQESVLMMEPDMIIGWYSTFTSKYLRSTDFWHKRGVGTYIAVSSAWLPEGQTLDNEFNDILNLGKILDTRPEAERLVGEMKEQIAEVQERTKHLPKRPRAIILSGLGRQLGVYGEFSLGGDLIKRLNGELLAPKEKTISAEEIVELDPDTIFFLTGETRNQKDADALKKIYEHPGFKNLKCVRNRRVVPLPLSAIYTPGVRVMDGIDIITKGLYPEIYK